MKKIFAIFAVAIFIFSANFVEAGHLEDIAERGTIKIGTTGDYKPMSYFNKETGEYEGIDAELSKLIAESLSVKIEYVPTTWKTLTADTLAAFQEITRVKKLWQCPTLTAKEFLAKLFCAGKATRKNLKRLPTLTSLKLQL